MPYVGQKPSNGRFIELDALTASATATYTLQYNSVNFEPESVHNLIVSINGVVQKPSSMSLSGSSLTVGATLSSSDTIDYVRVLGDVGSVVTPTDGSVTAAKIGTGAVTNVKIADNADISGSKLGTGAVLQVVSASTTSQTTHDQTSVIDITGLTLNITPKSTSSEILITVSIGSCGRDGNGDLIFYIARDGTAVNVGTGGTYNSNFVIRASSEVSGGMSYTFKDTPSTTSQITYKAQVQQSGSGNLKINGRQSDSVFKTTSTITAMEIGG